MQQARRRGGIWAAIWRSRGGSIAMGLALSVAMASALYASTWYAFYDTRAGEARQRAARIAADVELLARASRAPGQGDEGLRDALRDYLSRRSTLITAARPASAASAGWLEASSGAIDPARTLVEEIRDQLRRREAQRDGVLRQRESLAAQIVVVEEEYAAASRNENPALSQAATLDRLRVIAERKSRIEAELADHDRQVASYESELSETRGQLGAAEELLEELETRRGELEEKLSARSSELRKLQGLLKEVQKTTETTRIDRARIGRDIARQRASNGDSTRDRIEEQLDRWIRSSGSVKVNFSEHSRTVRIEEQLRRIDRAFVDRYFTHVTNPEYERGAHRLIRVNTSPGSGEQAATGELIVALDDDAGRTLGLRYELRGDAPDPDQVGFVLALLLRSHCRDFRGFAIRTR